MATTPVLYRGVSVEMHERLGGRLVPKVTTAFTRAPEFGIDEWNNCFWGDNVENAVVHHQHHQAGNPTSGVSTTPHLARAEFYATSGRKQPDGYVYVIDPLRCLDRHVAIYVVNKIVPAPSIPDDDEVILVASDNGPLPPEVIVDIRRCAT